MLEYDENNSRALLISKYGLDAMPYNTELAEVTWEDCSLRNWLNGEFFNDAFTAEEQSAILLTDVDNSHSQGYNGWDTDGGNNTQDRIFLLSYSQANKYFWAKLYREEDGNNTESLVTPTAYAISRGALVFDDYKTSDGEQVGEWWLRSPGSNQKFVTFVYCDGSIYHTRVNNGDDCIRPAFWLNLESEIVKSEIASDVSGQTGKTESDETPESGQFLLDSQSFRTAGNIVSFGHYEQDNNLENGAEEIEWVVLEYDEKNNTALLISKYGLDAKPYHTENTDITWENCFLRGWLNSEFLNDAFTLEEQSAILLTDVDNSRSQGYRGWNTDGGNNTQDRIFLLSYAEANRFFIVPRGNTDNMESRAAPSAYAISRGAWTGKYTTSDNRYSGWWWLRSPGQYQRRAASMSDASLLSGRDIDSDNGCVRPAFRINLDSDVFGSD